MAERKRCKGCRKFKGFFNFSEAGYCPDCERTRPWTIEEYIVKNDKTLDCTPEGIVFLGFRIDIVEGIDYDPILVVAHYTLKGFDVVRTLNLDDWSMAEMLGKVYPYVAK